jgi:hypothetical protein
MSEETTSELMCRLLWMLPHRKTSFAEEIARLDPSEDLLPFQVPMPSWYPVQELGPEETDFLASTGFLFIGIGRQ